MCGDSSKTALGGTIAVLKSTDSTPDISLLFNPNPSDSSASTTATFQSSTPSSSNAQKEFERCQIVIHRSGDLRSLDTDPRDILHSFPLAPYADATAASSSSGVMDSFQLPTRLDLGVGGEGVIGRRVSLVRRTAMGARVVGVGIIGWN